MEPVARFAGIGSARPLERFTGAIGPGRFGGGDRVDFVDAQVGGVDFSKYRFDYIRTTGSVFVDCDFSGVVLKSAAVSVSRTSRFIRCRFDAIRPGSAIWDISRFEQCSFERLRLKGWDVDAAEFVDCRFSGRVDGLTMFGRLQFPYTTPDRVSPWRERNELRGNDFSRLDLRFPDFRYGVDVASNTWPSGPDYVLFDRWHERLLRALAAVARWPEDDQREIALWWLRVNTDAGRSEQTEMLIRTSDWTNGPAEAWPRLWALMREDFV